MEENKVDKNKCSKNIQILEMKQNNNKKKFFYSILKVKITIKIDHFSSSGISNPSVDTTDTISSRFLNPNITILSP